MPGEEQVRSRFTGLPFLILTAHFSILAWEIPWTEGAWQATVHGVIQKTKIMASGPITSWEIDGETVETVSDFIFLGSKITADGDCMPSPSGLPASVLSTLGAG